jgi:hypothetical protein
VDIEAAGTQGDDRAERLRHIGQLQNRSRGHLRHGHPAMLNGFK